MIDKAILESDSNEQVKNMLAAKRGYKDGTIQYWDRFTLIFAGRIMETAPSYEAFTVDRHERLDQYARRYGEGWLWWETPLALARPDTGRARAMRGTYAQQSPDSYNVGSWSIVMGFQRLKSMVYRPDMTKKYSAPKGKEPVEVASELRLQSSGRISIRRQPTASAGQWQRVDRRGEERRKGAESPPNCPRPRWAANPLRHAPRHGR